jgi:hypothetical protein
MGRPNESSVSPERHDELAIPKRLSTDCRQTRDPSRLGIGRNMDAFLVDPNRSISGRFDRIGSKRVDDKMYFHWFSYRS